MRIKQLTILCLFVAVFSMNIANGQSKFTGGIIAGGSLSQLTGDEAYGYNKPSILVGVKAGYKFSTRLNLEVEFLYNTKGSQRANKFKEQSPFWTIELNYIEIPLLAGYKDWLDEDGYYHMIFYGGLSYGTLINSKVTNLKYKPIIENDLNKTDISFILGATYNLNKNLGVTARYNRSITKVWDKDFVDNTYSNYMKSYQISLAVQYMF